MKSDTKRTDTTCYLLYEQSKTVKLIETGSGMVFSKGWGGGINGEALVKGFKVSVCTRSTRLVNPRDLLSHTVPRVKNTVLCTQHFGKMVDLMLSTLITHK